MEALRPVVLEGTHVRLEPLSLLHLEPLSAIAARHRDTYRLTSVPEDASAMGAYF